MHPLEVLKDGMFQSQRVSPRRAQKIKDPKLLVVANQGGDGAAIEIATGRTIQRRELRNGTIVRMLSSSKDKVSISAVFRL